MSANERSKMRNVAITQTVSKVNLFETLATKKKHAVHNQDRSSKRPAQLQKMSNDKRFVDARTDNKHVGKSSEKGRTKELVNLNLSHRGGTLFETGNLDHVPDGFDEDENNEDGMLPDSFAKSNFGGGSNNEGNGKDRKTVIEEMIAYSNQQKAERQQENDEVHEMRQKLDEEFKLLMPRVDVQIQKDMEPNKLDGYDKVLREMVLEVRGSRMKKRKCCEATAPERKTGQQMHFRKDIIQDQRVEQELVPVTNPIPSSTPRIIDVPKEYNQFVELMDRINLTDGRILLIVEMIHVLQSKSCLHKAGWSILFEYILKYIDERFSRATNSSITVEFQILHRATPLLHDIARNDLSGIEKVYLELLKVKYAEFKKRPQHYPDLGTLVVLKLVPVLFSVSDRNHSIVTTALVFMGEILTRCQVRNRRHITRGLLLVTTVLECVEQSKRYFPSAVAFLNGMLGQACPEGSLSPVTTIGQPFKRTSMLLFQTGSKDINDTDDGFQLTGQDLLTAETGPSFKIRAIACSVSLATALCTQLEHIEAVSIIAKHFLHLLNIIQKSPYPSPMQEVLQNAKEKLTKLSSKSLPYLVKVDKTPKQFRFLEPEILPVYANHVQRRRDTWQRKVPEPLHVQRRKLKQKVKKMTRDAKREIRLDNKYIAKLQHTRRMKHDRERAKKVRQIISQGSSQQAELKAFERSPKRRNRI